MHTYMYFNTNENRQIKNYVKFFMELLFMEN